MAAPKSKLNIGGSEAYLARRKKKRNRSRQMELEEIGTGRQPGEHPTYSQIGSSMGNTRGGMIEKIDVEKYRRSPETIAYEKKKKKDIAAAEARISARNQAKGLSE